MKDWAIIVAGALGLAACGDDIHIGSVRTPPCGEGDPDCVESELMMENVPPNVVPAVATSMLTPVWTQSPGFIANELVAAADGGLWLFSNGALHLTPPIAPSATRLDADGRTVRTVELPMPASISARQPEAFVQAALQRASPHPLGPTVAMYGALSCRPESPQCTIEGWRSPVVQLVTVPEDPAAPLAVLENPERGEFWAGAVRSDDGQSFLGYGLQQVRSLSGDGAQRWEGKLRGGFSITSPVVQVAADRWAALGYSDGAQSGLSLLFLGNREGTFTFEAQHALAADVTHAGEYLGLVRTGALGELALVMPRCSRYPNLFDPPSTLTMVSEQAPVCGDVSVVRVRDGVVTGEVALQREGPSDLPIDAVGVDSRGTVYVATLTSVRDANNGLQLTPLLCRVGTSEGQCFALPWRVEAVVAGAPGTVFVKTLDTLARLDLPAAVP